MDASTDTPQGLKAPRVLRLRRRQPATLAPDGGAPADCLLAQRQHVLRAMVVAVQADAAVRIGTLMPPDGYALPHLTPTAGTLLAGGGGLDRDHALPGSCRLESTE